MHTSTEVLVAASPTVPGYPPDDDTADHLNRALVQEAAQALHKDRSPRITRFLTSDIKVVGLYALPPRQALVLETLGLLELPREVAEALEVDDLVTEVRIRVREE